jgi:hypothetical protein
VPKPGSVAMGGRRAGLDRHWLRPDGDEGRGGGGQLTRSRPSRMMMERSSALTTWSEKSGTRQTSGGRARGESRDPKSEHEGEGRVLGWRSRGAVEVDATTAASVEGAPHDGDVRMRR